MDLKWQYITENRNLSQISDWIDSRELVYHIAAGARQLHIFRRHLAPKQDKIVVHKEDVNKGRVQIAGSHSQLGHTAIKTSAPSRTIFG